MTEGGARRRAGMRDVAQAAGVSTSTVANVLNNPTLVAPATRQRVEEAIHRIGFVRSGPARQLRGAPSRIVGAITLDQANAFYAAVGRGIEDRITDADCALLTCSTDMRTDREARALRILEEHAVRGIIITPTERDLDRLQRISERGTPVILLDCARGRLDLCSVTVDHALGGQLVAEHLTALGHERIAVLSGIMEISPVAERRDGFGRAVAAAGLDPVRAVVDVKVPNLSSAEAAEAAVEQVVAAEHPPTAIVCVNDVAALGVLRGLARLGLRVPDDLSVVGYDDLDIAAHAHPALTTVRRPIRELGRAAAELLLDEDTPGHQHREIRFRPTLVVRGSTGAPADRR